MHRSGDEAPQIVTAEDQLERMRAGTKAIHEIRMRDMVIPVRVLSIEEIQAIRREAIQKTSNMGMDDTDKHIMIQKITLKMASTIVKGGGPTLGDKVLGLVSLDELQYLYDEYIRVMDAVNPTLQTIEPEAFRALVDALKKNSVSSKDCSLLQLRAICSAFVGLIQKLETQGSPLDKSSGGQPAE